MHTVVKTPKCDFRVYKTDSLRYAMSPVEHNLLPQVPAMQEQPECSLCLCLSLSFCLSVCLVHIAPPCGYCNGQFQSLYLLQALHRVPGQHCVQSQCLFQAVCEMPGQHCVQSLCLFQALHEVPAMPDSILYKAIHLLDLCLHFGPKTFPNVVSASAFQFKSLSALLLPWPRPGLLL